MLPHTDSANGFGSGTCMPADPKTNDRLQSLLLGELRLKGGLGSPFNGVPVDLGLPS